MSYIWSLIRRTWQDIAYGIDSGHAIKHGLPPNPPPSHRRPRAGDVRSTALPSYSGIYFGAGRAPGRDQ